jgi:outer membrane protein insertion porin family
LLRRASMGVRLSGGRLFPTGQSTSQFAPPIENRFDPIRFYAGGASDVRGYDQGQVGPKFNRTRRVLDENGDPLPPDENGLLPTTDEEFEPIGGLAKLVGNIELRMPFPGLSNQWRSAVFLDFGQVSSEETNADCASLDQVCRFKDDGSITFDKFKFGTGAGLRYETPIGYIRLDIAYKINPDPLDLQTARDAFLFREGFEDTRQQGRFSRFRLHLSLGQAF